MTTQTPSAPLVRIGPGGISADAVVQVARHHTRVAVDDPQVREAITTGRDHVDRMAAGDTPVYGVSTGFGALATTHVPADRRADLQRSLIRSHAAGSGREVEPEVVRAMMVLRLRTLASGRTGVRAEVVDLLAGLLNAPLTPVVHEFGSLGCSGDLAPLAAVALALMGEGAVTDAAGRRRPAAEALADAGLAPVTLAEKEGLALINGTDGMLGMLLLACHDLDGLVRVADVAAAMSVEAQLATDRVFAADLQALRPHPGQAASASNLRRLLADSAIMDSHRTPDCTRVQDAYSLRCAPQVAGAVRDTLAHARAVADRELLAIIDNPVLTVAELSGGANDVELSGGANDVELSGGANEWTVESNGNFHGAPVGYVLDFLAIAVADLASMSERRTDRFLDVARNQGLPPFLADDPGVDSGLMIAQYTQAGLVSECKRLAVPASVDSIPSSAMQEDHVSMGWAAARQLRRSIDALARVLAIEVLTGARALDLRAPLAPGPGTAAARAALRTRVPGPGPDRHLAPEIEAAVDLVASGALLDAVEDVLGRLD